jgi:hypothetical protein
MFKTYQQVINPLINYVKEVNHSAVLKERHLQILWLEQKFLKNLVTDQGESIEVISPGIWNKKAGPDFLNAHLRIGLRDYRGDIEIHIHEEGWYQHGHHCDVRYNRVILHISYERSLHSFLINKENGQQAFSCYLKESLAVTEEQLSSLIDLDLSSHEIFFEQGRCAKRIFQSLPNIQIKKFFQSAAYWRLEKKLNRLQCVDPDRSLQFVCGIAMALGYKHNASVFLDLFLYLMNYRDLPYQELLAIALGCCGFLEEGRKESWECSPYYQDLRLFWWGKKGEMTYQAQLKLDRIRPLHHPVRRLAYLTRLLQDSQLEELWSSTLHIWEMTNLSLKHLKEKLFEIIPAYQDDYWDSHYTFESHAQERKLSCCLGEELKLHFLLNTTLPLLYGTIRELGDFQKWEKFQQFYASLETRKYNGYPNNHLDKPE